MQTGVCLGQGSVCQVNADVLSNSWTQSFRCISYNDMTYIHPRAPALMHRRGKHGPCDSHNTLITQALTHVLSPSTCICRCDRCVYIHVGAHTHCLGVHEL